MTVFGPEMTGSRSQSPRLLGMYCTTIADRKFDSEEIVNPLDYLLRLQKIGF